MDIWISLVYAAIIGAVLWSLLDLTRRSLQSLRRRALQTSGRPFRSGLVAARLEKSAGISLKGAGK